MKFFAHTDPVARTPGLTEVEFFECRKVKCNGFALQKLADAERREKKRNRHLLRAIAITLELYKKKWNVS